MLDNMRRIINCLSLLVFVMVCVKLYRGCSNGRTISSGEVGSIRISGLSGDTNSIRSSIGTSRSTGSLPVPIKKETKNVYIPQEGGVTVTAKDPKNKIEDLVEFKVKNKGFAHALGLKATYPAYIGGDVKVVYWNRFGGEVGTGYAFKTKHMDIDVGASYRLDRLFPIFNTEIYCGYGIFGETYRIGFRINL